MKEISLEEMALQESISSQKRKFLNSCRSRINEAVCIFAERSPEFREDLSQGRSPFEIVIESSKHHDAEIVAGAWCYIESVGFKEAKYKVNFWATREGVIIYYRGQEFKINYGSIPKATRK
jgi:hypothetical protein